MPELDQGLVPASQSIGGTGAPDAADSKQTGVRIQAWFFVLVLLTFVAVLGQESFTTTRLTIDPADARYRAYAYGDVANGGKSTATWNQKDPSTWTCAVRKGVDYPFCGYGIGFANADAGKGLDLSGYREITLRFDYHGPPGKLRLSLKNFNPAYSNTAHGDSTKPNEATFDVVEGRNVIRLTPEMFTVQSWWSTLNHLTGKDAEPDLSNVVGIDVVSGDVAPPVTYSVRLKRVEMTGILMTPAQWYSLILAVWLAVSGLILVRRIFVVRRRYEEQRRAEATRSQALANARAIAEASSAAKSRFVANMSHELRTPLNAILGYAQLLEREALSERQLSAVQTISQSGAHLLTLITDILDMAKVEAGKAALESSAFDLHACIAHAARMTRLRAEEKGIGFHAEIASDVPMRVIADEKRLRQILINLLGNAVKFTSAGEVRLSVSTVAGNAEAAHVQIEVADSGPGIREEQLETIFEPFEQGGTAADRAGGTGLGLSIVRDLVQMMDGTVEVESEFGRGSTFRVQVALTRADLTALPAPQSETLASPVAAEAAAPVATPDDESLQRLLRFARAGNMRAIREEAMAAAERDDNCRPFTDKLTELAAAYQSPAVLRLIEEQLQRKEAA